MTLGYTLILASLFLKTNRIFRIFYGQFRRGPESMTPLGQVTHIFSCYKVKSTNLGSLSLATRSITQAPLIR